MIDFRCCDCGDSPACDELTRSATRLNGLNACLNNTPPRPVGYFQKDGADVTSIPVLGDVMERAGAITIPTLAWLHCSELRRHRSTVRRWDASNKALLLIILYSGKKLSVDDEEVQGLMDDLKEAGLHIVWVLNPAIDTIFHDSRWKALHHRLCLEQPLPNAIAQIDAFIRSCNREDEVPLQVSAQQDVERPSPPTSRVLVGPTDIYLALRILVQAADVDALRARVEDRSWWRAGLGDLEEGVVVELARRGLDQRGAAEASSTAEALIRAVYGNNEDSVDLSGLAKKLRAQLGDPTA